MCGFNGIFAYQACANAPEEAELLATRDHMRQRGPDGLGVWWSADRRLALGHRRLAIIDLSDRALQPMVSDDGLRIVVFNGEIYNLPSPRAALEAQGRIFRTTSDTEVLLHLYATHGADMVDHLRGMYAFAIWDREKAGLFLARDPYGIKPLYTADDGWTFRFASQVGALLAGGRVSRDPEPAGIVSFHLFGSVQEPFTLYRDIRALPAGHTQWIDAAGPCPPRAFSRVAEVIARGARHPAPPEELNARVRSASLDSVRAHLLADVEVGIFLSAGIDSGALLGLMRDAGQTKIRAITLVYDEFSGTSEDEGPLAQDVARHYDAEHVVRHVNQKEFREDLPAIIAAMDQPSIDGVNTWFVSKAAAEHGLKVAISGTGGDELLAGYPSFREIPLWVGWLRAAAMPGLGIAVRRLAGAIAPYVKRRAPKALGMLEFGGGYPGAYLLNRGLFLPFELREHLDADLVREGLRRLNPLKRLAGLLQPDPGTPIGRVAALEAGAYMRNQLLRDCDWAGMAHSLEIRLPLVDLDTLEALAPVLPGLSTSLGKRALAAAPTRPLPRETVERAKSGFGVPDWSFGPENLPGPKRSKGLASRARALDLWPLLPLLAPPGGLGVAA